MVDDIVTNVEDVKGSPIKSPKNLIEFSIVSQSNVNDSITNDADAEFDVEPNTEKINDMIQKLFMATEMIDMPPIKTPPKGAGYVVTSNTTLTVDTQQLFGFNESMQSVGAVAIDDCEDEEDNEDANASKTSAKRQMNESIMSIGDPMATAERKKNKESLNDSITSEVNSNLLFSTFIFNIFIYSLHSLILPKILKTKRIASLAILNCQAILSSRIHLIAKS